MCVLFIVWYGYMMLFLSFVSPCSVKNEVSVIRGRMFPSGGVLLHPQNELDETRS